MRKKERRDILRAMSLLSQLGVTMAACVLIGVFLGRFLDNLLGTSPWLLLIMSLMGAGAAIKSLYTLTTKK